MQNRKQKTDFLKLNIFKDNDYLQQYVELINNNINTQKQKFITECHHILPIQYFKYIKQEVDNSEENLVNLNYCEHVLAHCLLALCFDNEYLTSMSIDACVYILNSFNIYKTLEDFVKDFEQVKDVLKCNHFVSESQLEKLREISYNSRWYNNGISESFTQICPEGWVSGRLKNTIGWESQANKARERNKKCHWYNNGVDCTFAINCPDGWVKGRIVTEKLKVANATRNLKKEEDKKKYICKTLYRWYTDGTDDHRFIINTEPKGWVRGRSKNKKTK